MIECCNVTPLWIVLVINYNWMNYYQVGTFLLRTWSPINPPHLLTCACSAALASLERPIELVKEFERKGGL